MLLLSDAPATTRQVWLAEMEAARCAADSGNFALPSIRPAARDLPTPVNTEGSIHFCRQRRCQSVNIKHGVCLISLLDEDDITLMTQAVALSAWIRKAVAHGCLKL